MTRTGLAKWARLVLLAVALGVVLGTAGCTGGNVYVGMGVAGPYGGYYGPGYYHPVPLPGGTHVIGYPW
jgi:hypothetical protein